MIRKITVENFFSIGERQELDLSIAENATDLEERFALPNECSTVRIPRVIALFGANASGKTNVIKALSFMQIFISSSFLWPQGEENVLLPFLNEKMKGKSTLLSMEFDLDFDFLGQGKRVPFQYELEICSFGKKILRETLKYRPEKRMRRLFERSGDDIKASSDFNFPKSDPVRGKIRENASVISTLAQFNHKFSQDLLVAFGVFFSNVNFLGKYKFDLAAVTKVYDESLVCFEDLKKNILRFDLGISDINLEKTSVGIRPKFVHEGLDTQMDWEFESQGTQNFYRHHSMLWGSLKTGGVAIIDEFDNDIHPILLPELLRKFQDPELNPLNAQLIFSCHNASLLEHLTKEEVVFTDKNEKGMTEIYRLADVQGVRRDTNLYAKYLMGAFGAIPDIA